MKVVSYFSYSLVLKSHFSISLFYSNANIKFHANMHNFNTRQVFLMFLNYLLFIIDWIHLIIPFDDYTTNNFRYKHYNWKILCFYFQIQICIWLISGISTNRTFLIRKRIFRFFKKDCISDRSGFELKWSLL